MEVVVRHCDECGKFCRPSYEYCGMELCLRCYEERKDREAQTHTGRMAAQ